VRDGSKNIETILGTLDHAHFPKTALDLVFMVWVYHMMETPFPVLRSLAGSLKQGATIVILDPVPKDVEKEFRGAAPSAIRTRISRVRRATVRGRLSAS
jgi:hypothetical protein